MVAEPARRVVCSAVSILMLALLMIVMQTRAGHASDLVVSYDQSQLLRLPKPVASVIVGNPSVADVAVQGGNMLVVTGKSFGITNVIALDAERNVIQDQRIVVRNDTARVVNLTKGGARQSLSCTPECSPTLTIGDEPTFFDLIQKHVSSKVGVSSGSSSAPGANSGE